MRLRDIRERVARDTYIIDPVAVAEALLQRTDVRRFAVFAAGVSRPDARGRVAGGELPPGPRT
jgi:predicted RNA-binding protein